MSHRCPACEQMVEKEHFACCMGAKGGKAGKGASKARSSDQARAAVNARWGKKSVLPAADAALSSGTSPAVSSDEKISERVGLSGNDHEGG